LVNLIIFQAVRDNASDIHLEPDEHKLGVRYRIDGILHETVSPPKHLQAALISRVKIMANMDIAETRAPQDGGFQINSDGRTIEFRVSSFPTIYGENIVLRILDQSKSVLSLEDLGFSADILERYQKLLASPYGIILVTGPTGSGKTTTLYAALNSINSVDKNFITIEDPVEYRLPHIRQTQVNPKAGITFASGMRSILRQDPDVIMVGEMRDVETAEMAFEAALTGHLVFSTLHTNDAAGGAVRLMDMGIDPYLITSTVIAFIAQRLVRVVCDGCRESYVADGETLYRGRGCGKCGNTGYYGRVAICEFMPLVPEIQALILARASSTQIREKADSLGMKTLARDGWSKALAGVTTAEEVLRVTTL
jgi:type II secretory ATPase GspE/PulE/Tfp pilus assembly ATPase PilB-like protein